MEVMRLERCEADGDGGKPSVEGPGVGSRGSGWRVGVKESAIGCDVEVVRKPGEGRKRGVDV